MKKALSAGIVSLVAFISFTASANASYCDIGYSYNASTNSCDPYWMDFSSNDGFTSYVQLAVQSSNKGFDSGFAITYWLELICEKKKLYVHVYGDPLGLYADTNLYGNGSGQVKFDNGKVRTARYERSDNFEGIWLSDARGFVKNLMKAKNSVSLKISGINGPHIATFPKGDVASYAKLLRNRGCNF